MKLKVGDLVRWTSQSSGVWYEKTGTVVQVVPALQNVLKAWRPNVFSDYVNKKIRTGYSPKLIGTTAARNHKSYLIDVNGDLYWPRVNLLIKV